MIPNLIFVNYISRSGSTFLCQLLDRHESIAVGIEAGFPGHPTSLLPSSVRPIQNESELDEYLDKLFSDIRFKEWNISRTLYKNELTNTGYPVTFKSILVKALALYFRNENSEAWIHKAGYFIDCLDEARAIFPEAKHIYVQRDPRAIYNSQKQAISIYHNQPMGANVIGFVKQYRERTRIAEANSQQNDFLFIQYEQLVSNQDAVVSKVLDFIGITNRGLSSQSDYTSKIPDNQKNLHVNVGSTANKSSLDKWHKGLSAPEINFIENRLSDIFLSYNYKKSDKLKMSASDYIQYSILNIKYLATRIKAILTGKSFA